MAKGKEEVVEAVQDGNTEKKPTIEETIEILTTQVKEYTEKAEYFRNMSLKAQGALEVLFQMDDKSNNKGE